MMRTINVSADVFAGIWKQQKPGEISEDTILRRVLNVEAPVEKKEKPTEPPSSLGFRDARYGVSFPAGFEIFRVYLGKEYRAKAQDGGWRLAQHGRVHGSLNELSRAIGIDHENVWAGWFYVDPKGQRHPISDMRDPARIIRRGRRRQLTVDEMDFS